MNRLPLQDAFRKATIRKVDLEGQMTLVHVLDRSEAAALVSVPIEAIRALGAPIGASLRWEVRDGRLIIEPSRRNCPSFTELMGEGDVPKD